MHCSDVNPGSRIELKFIEKHRGSPDREVLVDYIVPDHLNLALVTKRVAAFPSLFSSFGFSSKRPAAPSQNKWLEVTVKFPDLSEVGRAKKDSNRALIGDRRSQTTTRVLFKGQPRWLRIATVRWRGWGMHVLY